MQQTVMGTETEKQNFVHPLKQLIDFQHIDKSQWTVGLCFFNHYLLYKYVLQSAALYCCYWGRSPLSMCRQELSGVVLSLNPSSKASRRYSTLIQHPSFSMTRVHEQLMKTALSWSDQLTGFNRLGRLKANGGIWSILVLLILLFTVTVDRASAATAHTRSLTFEVNQFSWSDYYYYNCGQKARETILKLQRFKYRHLEKISDINLSFIWVAIVCAENEVSVLFCYFLIRRFYPISKFLRELAVLFV